MCGAASYQQQQLWAGSLAGSLATIILEGKLAEYNFLSSLGILGILKCISVL